MAAGEEQHTTEFEDRLRTRVESIVGSVVGAGHARVQVTADMNYNHTSETSETFDPDSKVVRSTQTVEQNSTDTNAGSTNAISVANAEGIAEAVGHTKNALYIAEHVRGRLARQLCNAKLAPGGYLPLIALSPAWEQHSPTPSWVRARIASLHGAVAASAIHPDRARPL